MTNEEAIKTIKANYPSGGYEDLREALAMAIEALKEKAEREKDRAQWEHWRERGY